MAIERDFGRATHSGKIGAIAFCTVHNGGDPFSLPEVGLNLMEVKRIAKEPGPVWGVKGPDVL